MRVIQINVLANNGSTGRTTTELHNYLLAHGHSSYVAYGIGKKINDDRYFKISNFLDYYAHNICSRLFGTQGFHSKRATKKLIKWISTIRPDIIHLRNLHSNYINLEILLSYLKENNVTTIITTHDFWFVTAFCSYPRDKCDILECDKCSYYRKKPTVFYKPLTIFNKKKELFLSLKKIAIQSNSKFSETVIKKSFLNNNLIKTIYNWVDFKSFYPDSNKTFTEFGNKPIVLTIWSLLEEKQERFKYFVKISKILCNKYTFVMVGNHSFDQKKYPGIHFIKGTNDVNLLRLYYSSADLFFDPSTTDTFGKVVAESMSCGTPCVVFNNQALPELIGNNECGIAVEPFNVEETVMAFDTIISKGKCFYKDRCFKRSRQLFDLNTNCSDLVKLYEESTGYGK